MMLEVSGGTQWFGFLALAAALPSFFGLSFKGGRFLSLALPQKECNASVFSFSSRENSTACKIE